MDIVDYDVIINNNKILVFIKVEEFPTTASTIRYNSLNNIIYRLSDGYCVTDRKGCPLIIKDNLELCVDFLNLEYVKKYNVIKPLVLMIDENSTTT